MSEYYCLVAGLPEVTLDGGKVGYSVEKFREEVLPQLSAEDARIVNLSFHKRDNVNILLLLRYGADIQLDTVGCYTKEQLLEIISTAKDGDARNKKVPAYMYDFLDYYFENIENNLFWEDILSAHYYSYAAKTSNKFVSQWFQYNSNVNNILVALLARKYKLNVEECIVGEGEVADAIRTSGARDFGLSGTIDYLEALIHISENDKLQERERQIDNLRIKWLEDNSVFNYFTVERLFVFLEKLCIVERWARLDAQSGMQRYKDIIEELKSGAVFTDDIK